MQKHEKQTHEPPHETHTHPSSGPPLVHMHSYTHCPPCHTHTHVLQTVTPRGRHCPVAARPCGLQPPEGSIFLMLPTPTPPLRLAPPPPPREPQSAKDSLRRVSTRISRTSCPGHSRGHKTEAFTLGEVPHECSTQNPRSRRGSGR